MAVYQQPLMLEEWFRTYAHDDLDYLDAAEVLVVDDCGTPPATVPALPSVRLLRVTKDTPWNQGECRNLAAQQARGRVLLMLDPDMTIPSGELRRFVKAAEALKPKRVLRPMLRHGNGKLDQTSPNVYLIYREDFLAAKGYDLAYVGHKCWSDVELYHVMHSLFKNSVSDDLVLDFHHNGKFADAQVVTLSRDGAHNKKVYLSRLARRKKIGLKAFLAEHSPMVKSPWTEVAR